MPISLIAQSVLVGHVYGCNYVIAAMFCLDFSARISSSAEYAFHGYVLLYSCVGKGDIGRVIRCIGYIFFYLIMDGGMEDCGQS